MKPLPLLLAMLIAVPALAADPAADFFVAANGNDNWSGKLAAPNAAGSDGPFATVTKAQEVAHAATGARTIRVRGGTYVLDKPLSFTAADSNLTIAAYPNESPIFSGGQRITGWKKDAHGWWTVNLPEVKAWNWNFVQLFANGQRRSRPRLPREGYYTIAEASPPSAKSTGKGSDG